MTLSGNEDTNAGFIFRIGGFDSSADSNINLINGARATNAFIVSDNDINIGRNSNIKANLVSEDMIRIG